MRVIINASSIFKGGAEQVVNSFINECKNIDGNEYHIFLCENIMSALATDSFSENFHFHKLDKRPGTSLFNLYKSLQYFNRLEKKIRADVVISTGGHGYWRPNVPIVTGFNIPHYVYPESPYFHRISFKKRLYWSLKKRFDLQFYKRSDAIVVQTDDVKQRVKKLLPNSSVYTVSNTVNGTFLNPEKFEKKLPEKQDPREVRLITVSANYPHKNLDIIKKVLDRLFEMDEQRFKFVLTLPEEAFNNNFSDPKYMNHIINVGPVTIDECPSLYGECDMMFLPTLLECFSASYVEAMVMRKPIVTSDLGFAHTICKDAAIYVDPLNGHDIAENIIKLADDHGLQKNLKERGMEIYKQLNSPRERALSFLAIGNSLMEK